MSKSLAMIAMALGLATATAGSAWAAGGCGGVSHSAQSVALDTQTATSGAAVPSGEKPEAPSN